MTRIDQLRRAALALPEVEEATHFGMVAFSIRGKGFAWVTKDGVVQLQLPADVTDRALAAPYPRATGPDGHPDRGPGALVRDQRQGPHCARRSSMEVPRPQAAGTTAHGRTRGTREHGPANHDRQTGHSGPAQSRYIHSRAGGRAQRGGAPRAAWCRPEGRPNSRRTPRTAGAVDAATRAVAFGAPFGRR